MVWPSTIQEDIIWFKWTLARSFVSMWMLKENQIFGKKEEKKNNLSVKSPKRNVWELTHLHGLCSDPFGGELLRPEAQRKMFGQQKPTWRL